MTADEMADWPAQPAERVREMVETVLDDLELEGEVEVEEDSERITATIDGDDDYGLLIGKRGQTIDALQLLCYQAANVMLVFEGRQPNAIQLRLAAALKKLAS